MFHRSANLKTYLIVIMVSLFSCSMQSLAAQTETMSTGSYIINMGVPSQTINNALRPYGMIYDLTKNYQVPFRWVINPTKDRDGVDFTHSGVSYRGGPFIIPAEYRTAAVNARITYWQDQGVLGVTTTSPVTVPVYAVIGTAVRWTLDQANGNIAIPYLSFAGIPSTAYGYNNPQTLGACDDLYVMPHAEPTFATHSNLVTWNNTHRGSIWVGCKAGSETENNVGKFLSVNGLIPEASHGDLLGTVTYAANGDPVMQFLGTGAHLASANGAEHIYHPAASGWRPTTNAGIYQTLPTVAVNQRKAILAWGPGFGDTNRGWFCLHAGHKLYTADKDLADVTMDINQISAIRAFHNFSLLAAIKRTVYPSLTGVPDVISAGVGTPFSYTLTPSGGAWTTQWSASCGGTFAPSATSANVTYTPPPGATSCVINAKITDACGRVFFTSKVVTVQCVLNVSRTSANVSCNGGANGAINMTMSGAAGSYSWNWSRVSPAGSGSGSGTTISGLTAGSYQVTVSSPTGCQATFTQLIMQPASLTVTTTPTNYLCFGQSGAISANATGGTTPITYSWSGPGGFTSTNKNITNLFPGTYTVTATDALSCTSTSTTTVSGPATAVAVILDNKTDVSCNGGTNGVANITATGGTPGYTYAWSDASTVQDRTGLTADIYSVTTTDANGCQATLNVTIAEPSALTLSSTTTNVSCAGGTNGSILVTATGGTAAYNESWSGTASGNPAGTEIAVSGGNYNISGLSAGTYQISVTDANGCIETVTQSVTAPAALAVTTTPTNYICFGQTGSITTTTTGGTIPVTYSWSGPGGFTSTSQNISNLSPGTYTVTVTDARSCTITSTATVSGPATAVTVTLDNKTDVSCNGGANGVAIITANGGTPGYTYAWSDGSTIQDRTGLTSDTYIVTATDVNGCRTSLNVIITEPTSLTLSIVPTHVSCFGGSNGNIQVTATGGTAAYNVSWSGTASGNPAGNEIAVSGGNYSIAGLSAGTYTISLTDANGCAETVTQSITAPAALTATAVAQSYSCFGSTGGVRLTVTGGTFPHTYSWTGPGGYTSNTQNVTGAIPGTYNVTVADANLCSITTTATVSGPAGALSIVLDNKTNVICFNGTDGSINTTVAGGTPGYTYSWSDGSTVEDRTALVADTYIITVTDVNGCTTTLTETITEPQPLVVSTSQMSISCTGGSNGSITLNASGGVAPYQVSWSGTASGNPAGTEIAVDGGSYSITNLIAGTYSVSVTDANGCIVNRSFTLTQPLVPLFLTISITEVLCFGESSGMIESSGAGGAGSYSFLWSTGAVTPTIRDLAAGFYTVTVTDANGCTAVSSGNEVIQPAAGLTLTSSRADINCGGINNGTATVIASGGTALYTYDWTATPTGDGTATITGLASGEYTVIVTDANGCTATITETITEPMPMDVSTAQTSISCNGGNNGNITITASGGVAPYNVSWSGTSSGNPGGPEIAADGGSYNITNLIAGTYTVSVTDANGCVVSRNFTLTQPDFFFLATTGSVLSCFGQFTGNLTVGVGGGTSPYTYLWSNGATTQAISGLVAGTYSVTVTDANGCMKIGAGMQVSQPAFPLSVFITADFGSVSCFGGSDGAVQMSTSGGTAPYTYLWRNETTTRMVESPSGLMAGTYEITVIDANGCTISGSHTIPQPPPLELSVVKTDPTCPPPLSGDGTIDLIVTGGTTTHQAGPPPNPYTFSWATVGGSGLNPTAEDQTGLTPGSYTVVVTDLEGCTATMTIILINTFPLPTKPTSID
jgi:large repetitive protein